ncbi:Mth938-like domain-containing protein [Thalassorhabdomicrobium marinisediminis]|uniref:Mth938-like domain-containing protein n=1 Tax=Thalassorhabdomicrobium marinisediminis TaxID=2170577 RepID=A0A2T7G0R3_9RHOB|nr:Mth938-like domain-containing protein [Thalassorhabdomicrobium marinisediminis]PVA08016.1 hypothetical protein DC363_00505 [Thalassorhabdomicrobium marinisediminis]
MRLNEIVYTDAKPVDGYGPGFFRIGGEVYEGALVILPGGIAPWGGFDDAKTLTDAVADVDVIFVGTGAEMDYLPADLRHTLEEAGIGVEVMASPTACRTYNVLLSEGRRVGLALLPV